MMKMDMDASTIKMRYRGANNDVGENRLLEIGFAEFAMGINRIYVRRK